MRVLKFGGSSLATQEKRRTAEELVRACRRDEAVVVVVSALDGMTELLEEVGTAAAAGDRTCVHRFLAEIRERHEGSDMALLAELEHVLFGLAAIGEITPRTRDLVLSFGERLSAPLFAAELGPEAQAFDGKQAGIVTDERWGEASPLREVTRFEVSRRLRPPLDAGRIPVVTGFVGATQHGAYTTLGRGGSDFTATLIGAALGAAEVWLCSDVDGIKAANPKIVPDARRLDTISFLEALEIVQFGAKGIHPRALEPAIEHNIPVRIVNTAHPDRGATVIGARRASDDAHVAGSVHLVEDVALLTVAGAAMVGRPGTAARVFQTIADAGINILMISQSVSEAGISIALRRRQADRARAALEGALVRTGYVRGIIVEEDMSIIAIVGEGMRGTPGVAARVFGAVARAGINVVAIAQGSSELSISFVVSASQGHSAVRALYAELVS
ncbi:MAG: aspartate kinase [Candidatus Schekmanbacteria bacterium]|nr:aspartate kinase [Candidatus Schekmanbacteria bacterium]